MPNKFTDRTETYPWSIMDTNFGDKQDGEHVVKFQDYRLGEPLKGWRRVLRHKGDATTAMEASKVTIKASGKPKVLNTYFREDISKSWEVKAEGYLHPPSYAEPPTTGGSEAFNLALGDYYSSISDAYSEFKGGAFLGELKSTIQMIRSPASSIGRIGQTYLGNAKKLTRYKKAKERLDGLRDLYLELEFGWKPLLSDVHSAVSALTKLKNRVPSVRVHGFGKEDLGSSSTTFSDPYYGSPLDMLTTKKISRRIETSLTGSVNLLLSDFSPPKQLGFRIQEFVPTLWELAPWSFVVDYFTNIGDVITAYSNCEAAPTFNCRVDRRIGTIDCSSVRDPSAPKPSYALTREGSFSWSSEKVILQRSKFVPSPPRLQLQLPNQHQWINLGVLVSSSSNISRLLNLF